MVFSDDFLHFLKIKNFFCWIHQNYLVALMGITGNREAETTRNTWCRVMLVWIESEADILTRGLNFKPG